MLKRVIINGKNIPVPVPLRTLEHALNWVGETFIKRDETITRITLDQRVVGEEGISEGDLAILLDAKSRLEVQIDSPEVLSVQTLDAVRSLCEVVTRTLKTCAVDSWQVEDMQTPIVAKQMVTDLNLIADLIQSFLEFKISVNDSDRIQLERLAASFSIGVKNLQGYEKTFSYKDFARELLNNLEPLLEKLDTHVGQLQGYIYSSMSEQALIESGTEASRR